MSYKINRFHYNHSANAWVTKLIFEKWLKELSELLTSENPNEHFVLLADNFAGHFVNYPSNITLKFMPPNSTSRTQPLDAGIIKAFKVLHIILYR